MMAAAKLAQIKTFSQLVSYLKNELDWPITSNHFEDLIFEYSPEELGIDGKNAAKIQEIKRLRPLDMQQPWGIFFVKFEPKSLPVVALRRILGSVVVKKRASANKSEQAAWNAEDLLFISNYGQGEARQISFAHFSENPEKDDLPTLKVLGWDSLDTALHIEDVVETLKQHLTWPDNPSDQDIWRDTWRSAFSLKHKEVITTSKALAIRLAQLAGAIRDRIQGVMAVETKNGPLTKLMRAFQEALIHDLNADGFADMYAQTIAYGLLSARVTNPEANTADGFASQLPVTNPFLKELMETFLRVGGRRRGVGIDFDELGVSEVVALLDEAKMEAVLHDFGDLNPQEDPVIHFYELFLKEYDARARMRRGVFYTPRPVVSFIVRSVHERLQVEFGLEDGLADTSTWGDMVKKNKEIKIPKGVKSADRFVSILDPASGTGTFLVEVIDVIHGTLAKRWKSEGHDDESILQLWNEYVADHLLPRLHGYEILMAPYAIAHMKVGLKLHETGYRFERDVRARIFLTNSLEPAQDASGQFESMVPALAHEAITVNSVKRNEPFTVVIGNPPYSRSSANSGEYIESLLNEYKEAVRSERNIQPLSDDYIKFLRFADETISRVPLGIVGMITNNTFLSGRIHRGMRQALKETFSKVNVLDLHGSGKIALRKQSDARDENVFDIQQGVSISFLFRGSAESVIRHAELVGSRAAKYEVLTTRQLDELDAATLELREPYFLWVPTDNEHDDEFRTGKSVSDLFSFFSVSGKPGDDRLLISLDQSELLEKLRAFRKSISSSSPPRLTEAGRKIAKLPGSTRLTQDKIIRYAYRPFDDRWAYYDESIWTRPLKRLKNRVDGDLILLTTKIVKDAVFAHVFVTRRFPDVIFLSNTSSVNTYSFPLNREGEAETLLSEGGEPNLATGEIERLLNKPVTPQDLFHWIYGLLHSPTYRTRYGESLRYDFPRIPLTADGELFDAVRTKGADLVALHLLEEDYEDASWNRGPARNPFATPACSFQGEETQIESHYPIFEDGFVRISPSSWFEGVSPEVWHQQVGGYKVAEKWLKDRKGRTLSKDDISHYERLVVAISETIRLMLDTDAVIDQRGGWPDAFSRLD